MLKFLLHTLLKNKSASTGFTLIELLAVVVIAGILAAIAGTSFNSLLNTTRINNTQSSIFQAFDEAQSRAKRDKITYQVSIRRNPASTGEMQIAVHNGNFPAGPNVGQRRDDVNNWPWRTITPNLRDSQRILVGVTGAPSTISGQSVICMRFAPNGAFDLGGGCIAFQDRYIFVRGHQSTGPNQKLRCIRTTSLLGGITSFRQGQFACNYTRAALAGYL